MACQEKLESVRSAFIAKFRPGHWVIIGLIMAISAAIKLFLIFTNRFPLNADEAVVGLMAMHIQHGEIPIFFYGQAYMGSLDAILVALAFMIVGKGTFAIRLVQILLYSGTIFTTYLIGVRATGKQTAGLIAALLMAIPTVNTTLYTTISLGGYGEALLIGNLIILTADRIIQKDCRYSFFLLGGLVGFGLWVNGLTLVFSIPTILVLVRGFRQRTLQKQQTSVWKHFGKFLLCFIIGGIPWWIYGIQNGFGSLVSELLGSAITNNNVGFLIGIGRRLVSFLVFGVTVILGFRPSWEIRWLMIFLIPIIAGIWVIILVGMRKLRYEYANLGSLGSILWGVILTTITGFIFTSFGNDPSGRYFLPMAIPLAIFAGIFLDSSRMTLGKWRWGALILILVFHLGGTLQCWLRTPPGFTTQFDVNTHYRHEYYPTLIDFLDSNDLERGYSTYWVAYPLAFLSDEEMIFIPRLPYHLDFSITSRDDRYAPYDDLVLQTNSFSYITANQPWLDQYLQERFAMLQIAYEEKIIGDFHIYHSLSQPIRPSELEFKNVN